MSTSITWGVPFSEATKGERGGLVTHLILRSDYEGLGVRACNKALVVNVSLVDRDIPARPCGICKRIASAMRRAAA